MPTEFLFSILWISLTLTGISIFLEVLRLSILAKSLSGFAILATLPGLEISTGHWTKSNVKTALSDAKPLYT